MDRFTRPHIAADPTAVEFMDAEVKMQDVGDKLLELILNGPTINSVSKNILRHMVRQLYTRLKQYEDLEMPLEAIEQQLTNFSYFLMEMTGGRMSNTNYTVQAMVGEANNYQERVCDECSDRKQLEEVEKELAKVKEERDELLMVIRSAGGCDFCKHETRDCDEEPCFYCRGVGGKLDKWEWRGAKDTNVPSKEED